MDKEKVHEVVRLCDELKKRAKVWTEASKEYEYEGCDGKKHIGFPLAPKESGALRRISLDLTRALADMRRPR